EWREEVGCNAWGVDAREAGNGSTISSGDNVGKDYMEAYLILNLKFVRAGSVWFRYSVDAEYRADGLMFRDLLP
ncbi:hypothetical protein T484DRAFT_1822811, partial [Baffinella frigidus]